MPKKQTSAKVSKIAARILGISRDEMRSRMDNDFDQFRLEILSLAATALAQDEKPREPTAAKPAAPIRAYKDD